MPNARMLFAGALSLTAMACGSGGETEEEAPYIVSVSPADGARGVRSDADVVITFSTGMDPLSMDAALEISELGAVAKTWSEDYAILTLTPVEALEYASGTGNDPGGFEPRSYSLSVGPEGTDIAGVPLGTERAITFQTYLVMHTSAPLVTEMSNSATAEGEALIESDFPIVVGDTVSVGNGEVRGFLSFDLSGLPVSAEGVAFAAISGTVASLSGVPWSTLGDAVYADHVSFPSLDTAAFYTVPHRSFEEFAVEDSEQVDANVTAALVDDLENRDARSNRSQFRLRFANGTNGNASDDYVAFDRDELELEISYLVR